MKCPICGFIIENDHICPKCNENAYVLNKIFNISVRLYNDALQRANKKDFSNAIALIEKSLYFNKNNTEARNLLGLLYYHTGRLGDAIKQWILSTNINKSEKNRAFYYLDIFNKDIRSFEKLDDAVRLYNQAIKYLKNKNDDLAVIRLKKALEINYNFIDAMNLLAFCYIIQKKYKKALNILQKVLLLDVNNKVALAYTDEIESKKKKNKVIKDILSEDYTYNGMVKTVDEDCSKIKDNKTKMIVFSFIFGALLCGLSMYFLIMPDYIEKKKIEIEDLNKKIDLIKEDNNIISLEKDEEIKILKQENQEIKKQLQIYIDRETNYKRVDEALNLYNKGKKAEAKNILDNINVNGFNEAYLKKYNDIKRKIS